jgi:hypothetical protein
MIGLQNKLTLLMKKFERGEPNSLTAFYVEYTTNINIHVIMRRSRCGRVFLNLEVPNSFLEVFRQ